MITSSVQELKNKKANCLEVDLNKYSFDKKQITDYPKRFWFKGSRYR